ncbi:MAG: S8/S53 family peptidase [Pikeienuella sp.]
MTVLIKDLGPSANDLAWTAAQHKLAASDTIIGHIDTGLFPHPSLGYSNDTPPRNILSVRGMNFYDPGQNGPAPVTDLSKGSGLVDGLSEYPDHGVKTLSVILSDNEHLRGVAPHAKIIPYRVANGPVFVGAAKTGSIGKAIRHGMSQATPPRVFSISMGNTGVTGLFEFLRVITGGAPGMQKQTTEAINEAYEAGIILVCAGGQVIDRVVYPARFPRTIAVGGITADETHYPETGYDAPHMIDVWAYASHINRAAGLRSHGAIVPIHADTPHPENKDDEPSGTSYACPQVAAAAAMWVTVHEQALNRFDQRWKVVEAFRKALRASAGTERLPLRRNATASENIRRLDINALIKTPPDMTFSYQKAPAARQYASWL